MSNAGSQTVGDMLAQKADIEQQVLLLLQSFCNKYEIGVVDIYIVDSTHVEVTDYDYENPRMINRPNKIGIKISV